MFLDVVSFMDDGEDMEMKVSWEWKSWDGDYHSHP